MPSDHAVIADRPASPTESGRRFTTLKLSVDGQSVSQARHFARDVIAPYDTLDGDTIELAVSELVTNALRAAARLAATNQHPWRYDDTPVHLGIQATPRWALLAARDPELTEPVRRYASEDAESGRGVAILQMLSRAMWITHDSYFKTVHVIIPAPDVTLTAAELKQIGAPA